MSENSESIASDQPQNTATSPGKLVAWICSGVVALSVGSCIIIAAIRSVGLTTVTVTALEETNEPRDHNLPLIKQKEALPDYELTLILTDGAKIQLGSKPNTSAVNGLTWNVTDPVSIKDIATVRLQEQDKVISDAIAEVQIQSDSTTENGYRFDFESERSMSVGVKSFFGTPIGIAITAGFCIAIILLVIGPFLI